MGQNEPLNQVQPLVSRQLGIQPQFDVLLLFELLPVGSVHARLRVPANQRDFCSDFGQGQGMLSGGVVPSNDGQNRILTPV